MLHRRRESDVAQLLGLPADAKTIALIPLGYPMSEFSTPVRNPVETVTHWERWGRSRARPREDVPASTWHRLIRPHGLPSGTTNCHTRCDAFDRLPPPRSYSSASAPRTIRARSTSRPGGHLLFRTDSRPPITTTHEETRCHEPHRSAGTDQVTGDGVGRGRLRAARRVHPARLRPVAGVADPPHPRAPRAGRRAHGRGLRPRHRPPRRGAGDVRSGGDEPRDPADGRLHGLDPDGGDHRAGADEGDRQRRLPGVRHGRHHPLGDEAQRAGDDARGAADGDPPGVPHRHHRPARPGARRRAQGRAAGADGVGLAVRRRCRRLAARLPPDGQGSRRG